MFDLQKGFRLQDFNIFGESQPGVNPFADTYSLSTSGLGGDPNPTAQLKVSKTGLYDFRVNWRQSYYYWNQNDTVILPLGFAGLTNNHDWATVRKFGSADFTLQREVARLVAQGKSNRALADELIVSERTIEKHIERIMSKLGFSSRAQIAAWAVERGLYHMPLAMGPEHVPSAQSRDGH